MRSILVMNSKGGSGKTTISTNLASYYASKGKSVALVDLDRQKSALSWLSNRSPAKPPITGVIGPRTSSIKRGTDIKVIDAPAAIHGSELTKTLSMAESIIIPVLPSPIDMRAASDFIKLIKNHPRVLNKRAKIALVANRGRDYTNIYWELDDFLSKQKIPFLTMIRDSQNYIKAAERGLGIFEMGPAMTEIDRDLWAPIIRWLGSKRSRP